MRAIVLVDDEGTRLRPIRGLSPKQPARVWRPAGERPTLATSAARVGSAIEHEPCVSQSLIWDGVHAPPDAVAGRSRGATGVREDAGAVIEDAVVAHEARLAPGVRENRALA